MKNSKIALASTLALGSCIHEPHTKLDSLQGSNERDIDAALKIIHALIEKNQWHNLSHNSEMTYMNTDVIQFDMLNGGELKPTLRLSGFVSKDFTESPICNLLVEELRFDGKSTISRVDVHALKVTVPSSNGETYTDTVLMRPDNKRNYEFCSQWWEDIGVNVLQIDQKIAEGFACEEVHTGGVEMSGFNGTDFLDLAVFPPGISGAEAWTFALVTKNLQCMPVSGQLICENSKGESRSLSSVLQPEIKARTAQIAVECAGVRKMLED